tara:strand:+ start:243 stop:872 length:630 start_codon:yes stop_codon:yes gene_type:complete
MDSPQSIENEEFTDSNELLKKWFQSFVYSILLAIIVFVMVSIYANIQGQDTYNSVESHSVTEMDGNYIASGVSKSPSGLSKCDFEITSSTWKWYGSVSSTEVSGNCDNGEIISTSDKVKEVTFDHETGEWEVIFSEELTTVWFQTSGEYNWKLGWEGLIGLYIVLNIVGLIFIGKKFGVLPTVVFSIPAILLPLVLSVFSARSFDIFII